MKWNVKIHKIEEEVKLKSSKELSCIWKWQNFNLKTTKMAQVLILFCQLLTSSLLYNFTKSLPETAEFQPSGSSQSPPTPRLRLTFRSNDSKIFFSFLWVFSRLDIPLTWHSTLSLRQFSTFSFLFIFCSADDPSVTIFNKYFTTFPFYLFSNLRTRENSWCFVPFCKGKLSFPRTARLSAFFLDRK